jgi:hydroxymethylbilane synthase
MAQAERVAAGLRALGQAVAIVPLSTAGDRDRRSTFAEIGGRGIFAAEIEQALRDGRVDVAVHSAKDLPSEDVPDLVIAACLERDDPRDAWAGPAPSWDEVPAGARVATSSARRTSQLRRLRPDIQIEPVRGNVDTRLRKRTERGLDAVLLAACGLDRLDLAGEIGFRIEAAAMIPEGGQGVIAVQVRGGESERVAALDHEPTRAALAAERALTRALGGGCTSPVAVHAAPAADGAWSLSGYIDRDGVVASATVDGPDLAALVATLEEALR